MTLNLRREFIKFKSRTISWITPIILLLLMIITGIATAKSEREITTMATYNSSQWIILAIILVSSSIFSMEYQNNSIITEVYKSSNKINLYLAKLIVILAYNLFLHVLAILYTMVLQLTPLNTHLNWFSTNQYHQSLLQNMISTSLIDLITSTMIISTVFLISCIIKNNTIAVTLNLVIIFLGQGISASLLRSNPHIIHVLKWNPLNMTNLTMQYFNYSVYHDSSHLSNLQLLIGTLIYTILFFYIGYLIFKKRQF